MEREEEMNRSQLNVEITHVTKKALMIYCKAKGVKQFQVIEKLVRAEVKAFLPMASKAVKEAAAKAEQDKPTPTPKIKPKPTPLQRSQSAGATSLADL